MHNIPSEKIQMLDLKNQYLNNKKNIDAAIQTCINDAVFIKGKQVNEFEEALAHFVNAKYTISCANGTDALQIALMALNLKKGDEVIVPAFTYVATAEVIGLLGLKPVMVDVDEKTFNLNPNNIEAAISKKTKAIVPVHLFGQCAEMNEILAICQAKNIKIIEDAAQSIGSIYQLSEKENAFSGTMGDMGTTSFFPSKNLGCFGDGGAIFTNDEKLAKSIRMIANHGQSKKYFHDVIGVNSRLDTLQAAILLEKLKLLTKYTTARQHVAHQYDWAFKEINPIEIPFRSKNSTHVFHQYTIKVPAEKRDNLKDFLQIQGIPSMIYYPLPLNKQKAFQNLGRIVGDLSCTESLCQKVLSLPIHTEMDDAQVAYIIENIQAFFKNN